ncbi:hypothetical protein HDU97_009420 [Phlyctochytrium planicorne]|nr:hypothetical protein HDU97_009420 [Phlyctochytrium planicorne]
MVSILNAGCILIRHRPTAGKVLDPCAEIGTLTITTLDKLDHISSLKDILDLYPFLDLAKDTSTPLFPSKVDAIGELAKMAADESITTQFDLFSKITLLVNSLYDGHFAYSASCISAYTFEQPWSFHTTYTPQGVPTIKILSAVYASGLANSFWLAEGLNVQAYKDYTVASINGVEAVTATEEVAPLRLQFHCKGMPLRDRANIKTMVFGGASGQPFTPNAFDGGTVSSFESMTARGQNLSESQFYDLPKPFKLPTSGQIPVSKAYSTLGKLVLEYPFEWVPAPADFWIPVSLSASFENLWTTAAAKFAEARGETGAPGTKHPRPSVTKRPVDVTATPTSGSTK